MLRRRAASGSGSSLVVGLCVVWLGLTTPPLGALGQDSWGDVPVHRFAGWRVEPDYLVDFQFSLPGKWDPILNSCSVYGLVSTEQCSGHGKCQTWDHSDPNSPTFCKCDREWADPECRTRRKSQLKAFFYSLFLGYLGADRFYLGDYVMGGVKLASLGGFGTFYLYDLINIGAGQPYATVVQHSTFYTTEHTTTYRLAADLPHYAFVVSTAMWFSSLGFTLSALSAIVFQRRKRREFMVLGAVRSNYPHLFARLMNPPGTPYGSVGPRSKLYDDEEEHESLEHDGLARHRAAPTPEAPKVHGASHGALPPP